MRGDRFPQARGRVQHLLVEFVLHRQKDCVLTQRHASLCHLLLLCVPLHQQGFEPRELRAGRRIHPFDERAQRRQRALLLCTRLPVTLQVTALAADDVPADRRHLPCQ